MQLYPYSCQMNDTKSGSMVWTFRFIDNTCMPDQPLSMIHNLEKGIKYSMKSIKLFYDSTQALMEHLF